MSQYEKQNVHTINIDFQKVKCTFSRFTGFRSERKQILHGVSGLFKSGELTAVMGPSGSGKTTLLNTLTGFQKNFEGKITYRTESDELSWQSFKKYSRYIQQEDALHAFFTVQETMSFAAELKMDSHLDRREKQKIMDEILNSLGLIKTKETLCGNLSGGQRKRFSIALELINNPLVLFLDEPTTGLDIVAAMQCAIVLKNLAKKNRTIVCTIHQPSTAIYELFDHVYLIAEGRSVYQGDPMQIASFFGSVGLTCPKYHNIADYAMEVMSNEHGKFNKRLAAAQYSSWRKKDVEIIQEEKMKTFIVNSPSEFRKAVLISKFCLMRYYKDWLGTLLKFLIYTTTAIFVGLTYFDIGMNAFKVQSNIGMMVFVSISLFFVSIMPAVLKFPFELHILRKEHLNGWYKIRTYFFCFLIIHLHVQLLFITYSVGIVYIMTSQPLEWYRFFMFEIMLVLICFIGEGIGLICGTMLSPLAGTFAGIVVGVINVPFCGYFILFPHMSWLMYHVSKLMFSGYCLEGLLHAIYGFNREKLDCPSDQDICFYRYPKVLLLVAGVKEEQVLLDTAILTGHAMILFILAYICLKMKLSSI
ncbi:ATP-binding cassette sub-family G member 1-like isoform X2 [Belonocnema kinseyi]|uniref:ATP-binding cassette sub-family G member 1-like isoform X2 n=1 Tax=Belonocnema kinseyi TaxID=2817044 RepID=UPI00143CCA32|nr:ATP-binding cassette sub-family G member 1-like isoform X2 [Belonocnema kinseyi]